PGGADRRRPSDRAGRRRRQARSGEDRSENRAGASLHGDAAAGRSRDSHERRAAPVELPAVGSGLRGILFHREAVAALRPARALRCHRGVSDARAAIRLDRRSGARPTQRLMSNLAARLLTAALVVPVLLVAIFWQNPIGVWVLVYVATGLALREWFTV